MSGLPTLTRSSGVLLHPTSLPGPFGVGDLGPEAFDWADTLSRCGQAWWQVLPVGPTGYGDSPYQSPSTFAGNPNLINPEFLQRDGLAGPDDVSACEIPPGPIDYAAVITAKPQLVRTAWDRFRTGDGKPLRTAFDAFRAKESKWLDDYALFMAVKDLHGGRAWWDWEKPLALADPAALTAAREKFADAVAAHRFGQFLFFRQWGELRRHCHGLGVKLIGDLPIYVAADSADVWANPGLFQLDAARRPTAVAGVPPDYFAATGQLWGNPLYAWDAHRDTKYAWWTERVRASLGLFDLVRLDHFRGLEAYWAVPFGDATAERGRWEPGPRDGLLSAVKLALGTLPIIAEDLGFITDEVRSLRKRFRLPGMRILQFAFGGAVEERFLPHRYDANTVAYTGTHDNDTTRGWAEKLTAAERDRFTAYTPEAATDPVGALVRLGWASVADLAVAPLQDLLNLGSAARLNAPGTTTGNWTWRADARSLADLAWRERLTDLTRTYDRTARTDANE